MTGPVDSIKNAGVKAAETVGAFAKSTDNMGSVVKVAVQCFDFLANALSLVPGAEGLQSGVKLLYGQFKTTDSVIKATNIVSSAATWVDDKGRAENLKSWQKGISRITLTVGQVLDTVNFIDKVSLGFFSQTALCIGKLPIFEVVKNSFILISTGFSIWNARNDIAESKGKIEDSEVRQDKWKQRKIELGSLETFIPWQVISRYTHKIADEKLLGDGRNLDKIANWEGYVANLEAHGDHDVNVRNFQEAKTERLKAKYERRKAERPESADKHDQYIQAARGNRVGRLADHKVEKYSTRIENDTISENRSWFSIAADIGKIVIITIGMTVAALSLAYPILGIVGVSLFLAGLGIITNSFGLAKTLYKEVGPQMQKGPGNFSAAAA